MTVTNEGPRSASDLTGQRCGDSYQFVKLIGEGGMGQVWLCTSPALSGKLVAAKVLLNEASHRPESIARFRAEVAAAGQIDDDHIVEVYDTGQLADGRPYFLMGHCAGGSLADLIQDKGPLSFERALTIGSQIASALVAAHKKQITHRDVKPANILLVIKEDGFTRAKLGDFGIAKLHVALLDGAFKTGTMKILGSPGYMAPEQANPKEGIDHRADVYAFFSVFYEMVTGQRPYASNSLYDLINSVISNAPFDRPSKLRPDLPPGWEEIIMAGLAHRRDDRIDLSEAIRALARCLPNGTALLSYAAPRFVDKVVAPTSPTISEGIGVAATQWVSATTLATSSHRRSLAPLGAAMAAGVLIGGIGVAVLDRLGDRDRAAEIAMSPDGGTTATPPAVHNAEASLVSPDAGTTGVARPIHDADASPVSELVILDAPRASELAATVTAPPEVGAPNDPRKSRRASPDPTATGELEIFVDPWADVEVGGKQAQTPYRVILSAGKHRLRLSNPDSRKSETTTVTISPGKTTTIRRSW